ncbi:bifunctional cytochrome P450/NADPH--P450 reductase [Alkalihalophilus lindianensis]|uniref:Bifunctional cytochrome P450/NADPH--P450 reductase n=1 Tax=Alkalihalophilus lindianensis TaxID=1630542 RepID=A0ABU3XCV7_9BACI|nr:bifunctional cytochrome P450/NADPH--P450 reductase [Alkalihalophilus lindianensis]MDV2685717.1 bifunctional cytochrome P450/NADPH--P450 reductase [Alkalihalophilus lindianensis]
MKKLKTRNEIPQPRTYGQLLNLPQINFDAPTQSFSKLATKYGPIFRMQLPGRDTLYVSGHKIVEEVSDESRFAKNVWKPLRNVREFSGDGLFTSWTHEDNWKKAHNILLPSFSQRAMQGYHDKMLDIALQLIQKWARLNEDEEIDVPEDMTRLTLDTIGLCGFNYRFNSFYTEKNHPFIESMVSALDEAMNQLHRLEIQDKLSIRKKNTFKKDIDTMYELVDKLIADRKRSDEIDKGDLLSRMLEGVDPQTGEGLDDENIRYQMITFLIAGHETTSGLLSFAVYYLLKNEDKLKKAQEEVETVLTHELPSYQQVRQLKYIRMILEETLRLWPTAPAFSLYALEDTTLQGEYQIKKGDSVNVLLSALHRDKEAWGEDIDVFKPERFEDPTKVPENAYKPFGNGKRACIGQQFALHEATLVLGMLLREFDFIDHTDYQLEVKETLTLKPHDFKIKTQVRERKDIMMPSPKRTVKKRETQPVEEKAKKNNHGTPLLVLYGSVMGTAEGVARDLAEAGRLQGFDCNVATLNEFKGSLPKEGLVLIVSASYNGKPPENAEEFIEWLDQTDASLDGVRYAVFGCGDTNWASTYQKVPVLIDQQLERKGAIRVYERGEGNANADFEMEFEEWHGAMWPAVLKELDIELKEDLWNQGTRLELQYVSGIAEASIANNHLTKESTVLENRELQSEESGRFTRHLEIAVPKGLHYREGDHLGIIPKNNHFLVERVLKRFNLKGTEKVILQGSGRKLAHLPKRKPVSIQDLLSYSVELQEPASKQQVVEMASKTTCPPHKIELEQLLEDEHFRIEVSKKRVSMLDFLERYDACEIEFEHFLSLLPPLKPRYYSISSAPSVQRDQVSITVSVVRGDAYSGNGEYRGVASNYLMELKEGDDVVIFFRTQRAFKLPEKPSSPVIMVGPGTGIAPFRGFIQARDALKKEGTELGEAHLYFGSRHEKHDYLYDSELKEYEKEGIVSLHTAFSRMEDRPKTYVQDLMNENAGQLIRLLDEEGGYLYICGEGSRMAPDVEQTLKSNYVTIKNESDTNAQKWLDDLQQEGRYVKDVW